MTRHYSDKALLFLRPCSSVEKREGHSLLLALSVNDEMIPFGYQLWQWQESARAKCNGLIYLPFSTASNYGPCPLKRQRQIGQAFSEWTVESMSIFCQKKSNASQFQKPFGSLKQCIPTNNQPLSWSPEEERFLREYCKPKMWPSPTPPLIPLGTNVNGFCKLLQLSMHEQQAKQSIYFEMHCLTWLPSSLTFNSTY